MSKTRERSTANIRIRGARQNNLKNLDVDFTPGTYTVVTGPSGSGKSSLAFDTLYAEGQRRYVETFSAYARQFLERCDKPEVDSIDGVPPAIAINQTNTVRTSRSTVGTMTEINDHLKLLFAREAKLYCAGCGEAVEDMTSQRFWDDIRAKAEAMGDPRLVITFDTLVPHSIERQAAIDALAAQGYSRIHCERESSEGLVLSVSVDRFRASKASNLRAIQAIETALSAGRGRFAHCFCVRAIDDTGETLWPYTKGLACARCKRSYSASSEAMFSFNSAVGACPVCRGFGRIISIDPGLVIPDTTLSLAEGAIKPWRGGLSKACQADMMKFAKRDGIRTDVPFQDLTAEEKHWVFAGEPGWKGKWTRQWYGVDNYFAELESKSYKMHVRVLLARYRSYVQCPACQGARLKPEALNWRVGDFDSSRKALGALSPLRPESLRMSEKAFSKLPGLTIHDITLIPIARLAAFFDTLRQSVADEPGLLVIDEIRARLGYLVDVGLGYLTLDRQSRTLSGGEVQRVNLTTALGTRLVDTLFVLDEPSVGLHPRDMDRVNGILQRLKQSGNTLIVVEHDPQVMLEADRILDMGPGAGKQGGNIVFDGAPEAIVDSKCLTGLYLSGRLSVDSRLSRRDPAKACWIRIQGACEHNLKAIDAAFPIGYFTTVTGVSGSGKSTLVMDTLVPALQRHLGEASCEPKCKGLQLGNGITGLHILDQSSLGKSTRVTPVSFVGALTPLRELFAQAPLAIARGYTSKHFSFNNSIGRCPTCEGAGFERVEMQFLSDVFLRCPDCDGKRFRPEVLEVTINLDGKRDLSIADVLDMTVDQAIDYFYQSFAFVSRLMPLKDVGLGYLQLGQSVTTLSGGEAQRLRLAELLSGIRGARGQVFVLDEPTTGLHFDDIAKLLAVLRSLVQAGATVIVVEHNLDVMLQSDWIVDLGPEGGDAGGEIVVVGTPETVMAASNSLTGRAMRAYSDRSKPVRERMRGIFRDTYALPPAEHHGRSLQSVWRQARAGDMGVFGAREHNLRDFDAVIAKNSLTAVTGVSGSGKSTFAFGIVFAEGQRRYLESLNAYARSIVQPDTKPDVESLVGISPTVAIEQRTSRGGRKSTVATLTEIQHFLRLLYVRLGTQYCPHCGIPVKPQSADAIFATVLKEHAGDTVTIVAPLVSGRKGIYTELAQWAHDRGTLHLRVDGVWVKTDAFPKLARYKEHTIELPVETLRIEKSEEARLRQAIDSALSYGKGVFSVLWGKAGLDTGTGKRGERIHSTQRACPTCHMSFPEPDPRLFSYNSKLGWCPTCFGTGRVIEGFDATQTGEEGAWNEDTGNERLCPDCNGMRLNAISRAVCFEGRSICETTALSVTDCIAALKAIELRGRDKAIGDPALKEILSRLNFLESVGLGYLALDRDAPSLSGGEAQRIRLASQLGSTLQGVCYVLDEPTIGLHPRDNRRLIDNLVHLRDKGNTVLVVEHDEETIRRADYIIDIGPEAGSRGGHLIAEGKLSEVMKNPKSVTGHYLKHPLAHSGAARRPVAASTPCLRLEGAHEHNLQDITVDIPLARLVVLTGVSGSGKSTLARDVLLKNLTAKLANPKAELVGVRTISGLEKTLGRVLEVDQSPIGKTIRSCPATYVGFLNAIRKLYAETAESQANGWDASYFSFNTGSGRCPICQGQGDIKVEMSFLPDVRIPCDGCHGMRFAPEALTATWMGKSIGEVLDMSVEDAIGFFEPMPSISGPLMLMRDVGLGYLKLGQPSSTLSGGEAQRIKLVTELSKAHTDAARSHWRTPRTFYILDEPTVGLHMADVKRLIDVLHRLVDAGNTVLVVEHNLDVIAEADHIIDLGPEGGPAGGRIVGTGTPADIAALPTATGTSLKDFLKEHRSTS